MNRNRYWPSSLDVALNPAPVSMLVSRTCVLGTAEPEESVMVPLRVARKSCARQGPAVMRSIAEDKIAKTIRRWRDIELLFVNDPWESIVSLLGPRIMQRAQVFADLPG